MVRARRLRIQRFDAAHELRRGRFRLWLTSEVFFQIGGADLYAIRPAISTNLSLGDSPHATRTCKADNRYGGIRLC
jgi:hypothetical protein